MKCEGRGGAHLLAQLDSRHWPCWPCRQCSCLVTMHKCVGSTNNLTGEGASGSLAVAVGQLSFGEIPESGSLPFWTDAHSTDRELAGRAHPARVSPSDSSVRAHTQPNTDIETDDRHITVIKRIMFPTVRYLPPTTLPQSHGFILDSHTAEMNSGIGIRG